MSTDAKAPGGPLVRARGVRFRYEPARESFSLAIERFELARGEHTVIVGPSGCGKTTLLRLLTGVITPGAGEIEFEGRSLASASERTRRAVRIARIGMVFQHFALLDYLSALDNILLPFRLHGGIRLDRAARARAEQLADRAGIAHTLARKPARLSQGERQRVAICRALVTRPALVVCDEPTGNLDPTRSRSIIELILETSAGSDATVLAVTHDHGLLDRFARVVELPTLAGGDAAGPVGAHAAGASS
ncbi:MAG: ABC transporter ATP-binding protein [Phycisphaerales bacterium JB037]